MPSKKINSRQAQPFQALPSITQLIMENISSELQVLWHRVSNWFLNAWAAIMSRLGFWDDEKQEEIDWQNVNFDEFIEKMRLRKEAEQKREKAHAAAKSGEGPQPWDADWYENDNDHEILCEVYKLALKVGWHRLQFFREIMELAWLSPQMQQAARVWASAEKDGTDDSLQGAFELWRGVYAAVRHASCEMLRVQAGGLGYTEEWEDDLEQALATRLGNKEQVAK